MEGEAQHQQSTFLPSEEDLGEDGGNTGKVNVHMYSISWHSHLVAESVAFQLKTEACKTPHLVIIL